METPRIYFSSDLLIYCDIFRYNYFELEIFKQSNIFIYELEISYNIKSTTKLKRRLLKIIHIDYLGELSE